MNCRSKVDLFVRRVLDSERSDTSHAGQMVPRVLYGLAGVEPEFDDAYVVPGLEDYRDGVKMVFNSMLHSQKTLTRKPQGSAKLLPKWMTIEQITEKIIHFHEPVAHIFYASKGLYLSFKESTILVDVLVELLSQGVTALPIHDAIIVREDHKNIARSVMLEVFKKVTGIEGLVKIE
jgi:hypothetical protein